MARNVTPPERKDVQITVKLAPDLLAFMESEAEPLGLPNLAAVIRKALTAYRTWHELPVFMAERLAQDASEKDQTFFVYVQEMLARRYEQLAQEERVGGKAKNRT